MKYFKFSLLIGVIILGLIFKNYNPNSFNFYPKCIIYKHTGMYCTGCGSQRMLHFLLNLSFCKAIQSNALAFTFFILLIYEVFVHFLNTKTKSYSIFKLLNSKRYVSLIILVVIVAFTILRNIPIYPFNLLAPD